MLFVEMKEKPANLNRGVRFSMKWKATCQNWAHLDEKKNSAWKVTYALVAQSPSIVTVAIYYKEKYHYSSTTSEITHSFIPLRH